MKSGTEPGASFLPMNPAMYISTAQLSEAPGQVIKCPFVGYGPHQFVGFLWDFHLQNPYLMSVACSPGL